jgi:thioredoxin family protein
MVSRHITRAAILMLGLALLGMLPGQAAKDPWKIPGMQGPRLELVVFEAQHCGYCEIFRRDIVPSYNLAPMSTAAPMRFIDISRVDVDKLGLSARLDVLPTTVMMKDGREIERISGLTSPSTFYALMKHMIAKNDN